MLRIVFLDSYVEELYGKTLSGNLPAYSIQPSGNHQNMPMFMDATVQGTSSSFGQIFETAFSPLPTIFSTYL